MMLALWHYIALLVRGAGRSYHSASVSETWQIAFYHSVSASETREETFYHSVCVYVEGVRK